jgi:hypothetical protein
MPLFTSKTEEAGDGKETGPGARRAPVVITIGVLAVVGSLYYGYYHRQVEYFTGRNLRLLSMLTAQVEGRVEMFSDFVKAQAGAGASEGPDPFAGSGIKFGDCASYAPAGEVRRGVDETEHGFLLRLQSVAAIPGPGPPQAAPTCNATVEIDDLIRPIFERPVSAAFDMLLVARDDGTVLYSVRPPQASSSLLHHDEEWIDEEEEPPPTDTTGTVTTTTAAPKTAEKTKGKESKAAAPSTNAANSAIADRESGSTLSITTLKALKIRKGWRADPVDLDLASLTRGTGQLTVTLGGTDYVLFTQPYTLARPVRGTKDGGSQWVVCGLVSSSRFRDDVSAVSTTVILLGIAIALLVLCCWPFLRIALIDPAQALTITDVVLIIMCTIVGAGLLTLALLDVFAYRGITATADDQIEKFSGNVDGDFGRDVVRAMHVLSLAEKRTLGPAMLNISNPTQPLPAELVNDPGVGEYPYIDSIAWLDDDGMQKARFARILPSPRLDVSGRQYFHLAKLERTWSVSGVPYVLEWVRSKATGEVRAILAKKTEEAIAWDHMSDADKAEETIAWDHLSDADKAKEAIAWDQKSDVEKAKGPPPMFTVIAMATELIDIAHAVPPPGVQMAIIDENGEVIYHSDTQRIGYENFFAEADRNMDLRAAVVARRARLVSATYWGEDQSMYVRPLTGSNWTLVTFRAKRLTRVLNVEATLLTLMMLLFNSAPYLLVYMIVLILKPRYRAPRLWPDETRHGDYLRLVLILIVLMLLSCLNNYALAPWSSFYGIVLIPLLSIVTTYVMLHRTGAPRRLAIGLAAWIIVTVLLIVQMSFAGIHPERAFAAYPGFSRAFLVLATVSVAALTLMLIGGWKHGGRVSHLLRRLQSRYGYSTLYRVCGVLLMLIGAALPVVGFFRISRSVELELMVKYGQLRAAAGLEQRIDQIVTLSALPPLAKPEVTRHLFDDILTNRLGMLFGSSWSLDPPVTNPAVPRESNDGSCPKDQNAGWTNLKNRTIPTWASSWLPALYEDSLAIQPLFEAGSSDNLWHWCVNRQQIKLVRKIHFDSDVADVVWNGREKDVTAEKIVIDSHLPRASFWKSSQENARDTVGAEPADSSALHVLTMILIGVPLLSIFWYAAGFVARRVLLIDVSEPDWLARKPLSPTLGDHIFLVRRDRNVNTLTSHQAFVDVSFASLDQDDNWTAVLEMLDSSEAGRNVRVIDFEHGINDSAVNGKKLPWIERLLALADRTVIVVSNVSPAYVMTTQAPPDTDATAYVERWRALLDHFVIVTAEELDLRHEEWRRRNEAVSQITPPKSWLAKETAYNSFLRVLARELEAENSLRRARTGRDPDTDQRRFLDEIGERAETYFAGLWSTCREDEKLLLYHLAHNGLANARARRTIRRLMARGLVRRDPNLELFSESFRLYVLEAAQRENIVKVDRQKRGASTWDSLRVPFFVIIIAFILLLFATQKDMLTTTTALATALTTGLPVLMKLIGVFTERRTEAKE